MKERPAIEQRVDLWSDSNGLQAFVQYGNLHLQFGAMVVQVSAHEKQRTLPPGISVHLRDSGRLVVMPAVSNVLVIAAMDS